MLRLAYASLAASVGLAAVPHQPQHEPWRELSVTPPTAFASPYALPAADLPPPPFGEVERAQTAATPAPHTCPFEVRAVVSNEDEMFAVMAAEGGESRVVRTRDELVGGYRVVSITRENVRLARQATVVSCPLW